MSETAPPITLSTKAANVINYIYHGIWETNADPRTSNFPLMTGGPWAVLLILSSYLYFIKIYGPRLMKNREPMNLRQLIFVYNIFMMFANGYFFTIASYYTRFGIDTWGCTPIDRDNNSSEFLWQLKIIWFYFITKFIDLMESVFFVLRKKDSQLSPLHVFHHTVVPIDVWFGLKYSATGSAGFFPFINSFVHTLMYFYYALSTFGDPIRPYLWWKKYLTQIQIFQLILVAIHCFHLCLLPNCNVPKEIFAVYLPQALLLVYLFCSFFIKTYLAKRKAQ